MSKVNLVSFLDSAQRTIIGENLAETDSSLKIKNPVVVNIVPQSGADGRPNGQMALQLLPVYFREFQGEKKNPTIFTYAKSQIVSIEFEGGFDFRLYAQYEHIFNAATADTPKPEAVPTLKLFDGE